VVDPLTEIVTLLQPGASSSKLVSAAGTWRVHRSEEGRPFYCAILDGSCRLNVDGLEPIVIETNDFVLIPAAFDFTASSLKPPKRGGDVLHTVLADGEIRHGDPDRPADVRMVIGYCAFGSPDTSLVVSLLPKVVHIRKEPRLATLVELIRDESQQQRPARDAVVARLLEVLLIEALRSLTPTGTSPGLVRGLADDRLAIAIRRMHEDPSRSWTVALLASEAALSRSTFFERFNRTVGVAPIKYLLRWRMALAKDLLQREHRTVAEVAKHVGYSSASTFSVAFTRHVGTPPSHFSRDS
jgi:AraC-like DNA-binding protein